MADVLWLEETRHGGALLERVAAYFQPVRHFAHAWEQFFDDMNGMMETDWEDSLDDFSEKLARYEGNFTRSRSTVSVVHLQERSEKPAGSDSATRSSGPHQNSEEGHLKTSISYCKEHGPTAESLSDANWYRSQIIKPQLQRRYATAYEEEDSRPNLRGCANLKTGPGSTQKTPYAQRLDRQIQTAPLTPTPPQPTTHLTTPADEERILGQLHVERETAALRRKEHISEVVRATKAAAAALEQRYRRRTSEAATAAAQKQPGPPPAEEAASRPPRRVLPGEVVIKPMSAQQRQLRERRAMTIAKTAAAATTTTATKTTMTTHHRCLVVPDDKYHHRVPTAAVSGDTSSSGSRPREVCLATKRTCIAEENPRRHRLPECTWRKSKTRSPPKDGVPVVVLTEPEGQNWYLVDSMSPMDEDVKGIKGDSRECSA